MQYLVDTVGLVRHFTKNGRMGHTAEHILKTGNGLAISVISLMEIMYLAEKHRIAINLTETLTRITKSSRYTIVNLSPDILQVAETIDFYELHDRLILATAKRHELKVISSDGAFSTVEGIETIWD